jgi:hypothetical protein
MQQEYNMHNKKTCLAAILSLRRMFVVSHKQWSETSALSDYLGYRV